MKSFISLFDFWLCDCVVYLCWCPGQRSAAHITHHTSCFSSRRPEGVARAVTWGESPRSVSKVASHRSIKRIPENGRRLRPRHTGHLGDKQWRRSSEWAHFKNSVIPTHYGPLLRPPWPRGTPALNGRIVTELAVYLIM